MGEARTRARNVASLRKGTSKADAGSDEEDDAAAAVVEAGSACSEGISTVTFAPDATSFSSLVARSLAISHRAASALVSSACHSVEEGGLISCWGKPDHCGAAVDDDGPAE